MDKLKENIKKSRNYILLDAVILTIVTWSVSNIGCFIHIKTNGKYSTHNVSTY